MPGNAINRPSQMSFNHSTTLINVFDNGDHMYATGGLYAPTIRHHNGTFYIVCTNVVRHKTDSSKDQLQNFIISTTNIHANTWSDPVYFDFNGIDPSLFFDPSGKAYICGSQSPGPSTKITLFEINLSTGAKLSPEHYLWHGTGGIYPEGPHIYFRNGFYYLLIAEGGTHEGHSVTMARSKNLLGPYEASPRNPVLSAAETEEYVQCTGHCEAFEGKDGEWWGVCLGIRMGEKGLYGLGRETFLTRGRWDEEGWLAFDVVKTNVDVPGVQVRAGERLVSSGALDVVYIHDPVQENYRVEGSVVELTASKQDLTSPVASPTFLGKRQRRLDGESSVVLKKVESQSKDSVIHAGLVVYKDEHRFLRISFRTPANRLTLQTFNKAKGIDKSVQRDIDISSSELRLVIGYTEKEYRVSFQVGQGQEVELGRVDAMDLSGKDFVGPIIGLFAHAEAGEGKAKFEGLIVDGENA